MGYWTRTLLGLGLIVAGVAGLGYCIYRLVHIGTCASGGPYVSARECPSGTGALIAGIFPALFVVSAGVAVYAGRGGRATAPGLPPG
jgi:hypothetical protein